MLAPTFDDLKRQTLEKKIQFNQSQGEQQVMDQSKTHHGDLSNGLSKISIIGTGGAGKVAAIRCSKMVQPTYTQIVTIDTSGSDIPVENVTSLKIKNLNGSGKLRRENIEDITNFVNNFASKEDSFSDVNIIISSYSGGSGSTLCPLLVDEILRKGKIAIVIGIIDTDSEIDTVNTFNTFRSLDNFVSQHKAYLPTILFNNSFGRPVVDKGVDTVIKNLIKFLTTPYIGLDVQDRIKFLNPNAFGVEPGIKLVSISTDLTKDWDNSLGMIIPQQEYTKLDAILSITKVDNHVNINTLCSVTFKGYYDEEGPDFLISIGYQIPKELVASLNGKIHEYKSVSGSKRTEFSSEYEIGETTNKGMVL
jgi:hypothetical protein